jgi:hypothetical protein
LPAPQLLQVALLVAPRVVLKAPAPQEVQMADVWAPTAELYVPAPHCWQTDWPVTEL